MAVERADQTLRLLAEVIVGAEAWPASSIQSSSLSEIINLRIEDVHFGAGAHVNCMGKGRKMRITP